MPVRLLVPALAAVLLAGCGGTRTAPPDPTAPVASHGELRAERFGAAGVALGVPAGWVVRPGRAPLVATITSGRAALDVFRYPRTEPLPRTATALDAAVAALAGAARQRDPTFAEAARSRTRVDGRPGVALRGTEDVAGQPRTVRSTHAYAFGAEVVLDALAPAADFARVDADSFRAVVRSVELFAPSP